MFTTTRGNTRNNLFIRLWNLITGFFNPRFEGKQRSLSQRMRGIGHRAENNYDLEISEIPIRDAARARELIEISEYCPETARAIEVICHDVPASADGDDMGFAIPDDGRYEEPVDERVLELARSVSERVWTHSNLEIAISRLMAYGDFFAELDLKVTGNPRRINGIMFLPTWEMFRVEINGNLCAFEQRKFLTDSNPIRFPPVKIVHGRYRRKNLYGRSLFHESPEDWAKLKDAIYDLATASRSVGVNPNIHTMPEGVDEDYKDAYRDAHEMQLSSGAITDFYFLPGHKLEKLASSNPDLKALVENVELWRKRIIMKSGVPSYLMGIQATGAQDISGQPAMAYSRMVNSIRMVLSESIRQTINTELALNQVPQELWTYRIKWPRFSVNLMNANQIDTNLGEDPDIPDTDSFYPELFASHSGFSRL